MPKISVIVPVYKVEKYLDRCVESVLAQTFTDFELILVDDGSPDDCPRMCDDWAKKDDRITVIHKPNGGLSSARNAGLKASVGKYVLFCDSDDTVADSWCQLLYNSIIENPSAWIVSNIQKVYGDGSVVDSNVRRFSNPISYFDIYKAGLSGYTVNKIYELEKLNNYNICFDENCRFAEDLEFNVKYFALCDSIVYIDQPLYYYLQNPTGIMGTYRPDLFAYKLKHFELRFPLISPEELPEFCDIYLYHFLCDMENTMDKRNKMSYLKKLMYNHNLMKNNSFSKCLKYASGKSEGSKTMSILRKQNYYLYELYRRIIRIKQNFGGNK